MSYRKHDAFVTVLLIATTVGGLFVSTLLACPQETVKYRTFTVRQFVGNIEPPSGDGLLPSEIEFLVREKGKDKFDRKVPVRSTGDFAIGLPEGTYEFQIKAEGFLFTVVGEVTITRQAGKKESIHIRLPWCSL